jgi:hypothetical protein
LSSGHITNTVDAAEILLDMDSLLYQVATGQVKGEDGGENYGIKSVTYTSKDKSLAFSGFEAAFTEFLGNDGAVEGVQQRNPEQGLYK